MFLFFSFAIVHNTSITNVSCQKKLFVRKPCEKILQQCICWCEELVGDREVTVKYCPHQLAAECKRKSVSLRFGSQRGAGTCFAFLAATRQKLVYGRWEVQFR